MADNDSGTPDTERNRATVLRFMELMDAQNFDALGEVLASDLQLRLGDSVLDRHETEAMIKTVYEAFPDFTHTVEEVLAADDCVVLRSDRPSDAPGCLSGDRSHGASDNRRPDWHLSHGRRVDCGNLGTVRHVQLDAATGRCRVVCRRRYRDARFLTRRCS